MGSAPDSGQGGSPSWNPPSGVVSLPDGSTVVLDPSCPWIEGPRIWAGRLTFLRSALYGCCLPNGQCGVTRTGLPAAVPLGALPAGCLSYAEFASLVADLGAHEADAEAPPFPSHWPSLWDGYLPPPEPELTCAAAGPDR